MPSTPAPVAVTGGAGFLFEDEVAAFFLTEMLAVSAPLELGDGAVVKIDWQARSQGWILDDLVLTLSRPSEAGRLALSIKSDRQVTTSGFPADFVRAAWEQWLGASSGVFRQESDLLGLACGRLSDAAKDAWDALVGQALVGDPSVVAERFSSTGASNQVARDLFASLHCPEALSPELAKDAASTARLVRHLRLLHFDFGSHPSGDWRRVVQGCRALLASGDSSEAEALAETLRGIAAIRRPRGGSLDGPGLLQQLRGRFRLKGRPDHDSDWARIQRFSTQGVSRVRNAIAGGGRVERKQVKDVQETLAAGASVVLVGPSGTGKSAIARDTVVDSSFVGRFIWLDADSLDREGALLGLEAAIGLSHPLSELMANTPSMRAVVVLDAVEQFGSRARATAISLLRSAHRHFVDGPWSLLVTARLEGAESADQLLQDSTADFRLKPITVDPPSLSEVRGLLAPFPALRSFAARPDVATLLGNLKVVDWLVQRIQGGLGPTSALGGHSDLIEWIWLQWVGPDEARLARSGLLKRLGASEGGHLALGVGLTHLSDAEARTLEDLERLALVRVTDERAFFQHDLIGDWARLRILIEQAEERPGILTEHQRSPRWHHAIRLYGQRILEKEGVSGWQRVWDTLAGEGHIVARDLLLESLLTAANAAGFLEELWPRLVGQEETLRRLLTRFLWVATVPHPGLDIGPLDRETKESLRARMRVPYWPYWPPVIPVLASRANQLVDLALAPTVEVFLLWLRYAPIGSPLRRESGEAALLLAGALRDNREEFDARELEHELATMAFEAALLAAPELADRVAEFALLLSGHSPPGEGGDSAQPRAAAASLEEPASAARLAVRGGIRRRFSTKRRTTETGAVPDSAFRKAVLRTTGIAALARAKPQVALEVLLSSCRETPPSAEFAFDPLFGRDLGVFSEPSWYPPMFFRGPFLLLLRETSKVGLEAVVRLTNEATAAWDRLALHWDPGRDATVFRRVTVTTPAGPTDWIGDARVFGWYRNLQAGAPLVVSALMALEKWFYERLDTGEDVGDALRAILTEGRSTALLGVLSAVALKQPSLLDGALQPILGIWQLYEWQDAVVLSEGVWQIEMSSWALQGESFFNLAREWHSLPHRRRSLREIGVRLLNGSQRMAEFYAGVRPGWDEILATLHGKPREHLELLIARFDPSNYQRTVMPDGVVEISFQWPEAIRARTEQALADANRRLALFEFPSRCRRAIDAEYRLSDEEAEAVWGQIAGWESERGQDPELDGKRCDAIVAGIALLWLSGREWLTGRAEREVWCRNTLVRLVETPPARRDFSSEHDVSTHHWHSFLADLAPMLLVEDRGSAWVREWTARSVTSFWYATTALSMRRAFLQRHALGDEFARLQNLLVWWAALRHITRFVGRVEECKAPAAHWQRRMLRAFVDGHLSATSLDWARVSRAANRLYRRVMRRRYVGFRFAEEADVGPEERVTPRKRLARESPGLDLETIQAGFRWLPPLAVGRNDAERDSWIGIHKRLLGLSFDMLPTVETTGDEVEGTPYEFDLWVYGQVAALIVQLPSELDPGAYWRPVLELGAAAHYWVETFLDQWFFRGSEAAAAPKVFVDRWEQMIRHALASPAWARGGGRWFRVGSLWQHLLGFTLGGQSIAGRDDYAAEVARLRGLYQEWAHNWLTDPESAVALARFMVWPLARELRGSCVVWLRDASARATEQGWWDERGLEEALVDGLRAAWIGSPSRLAGDDGVREAFVELLDVLVRRGSPGALDLRDRVSRSGSAAG